MKDNPIIPKVWITRRALEVGIRVIENSAILSSARPGNSVYCRDTHEFFYPKDWHTTESAAHDRVVGVIAAKRKSIEKQLTKLDKLAKEYA
jgi:hypothetical protein